MSNRQGYELAREASLDPDFEYVLAKLDVASHVGNFVAWQEVLPTSINAPLTFTVLPGGRSGTIHSQPAIIDAEGTLAPTSHQPYALLFRCPFYTASLHDVAFGIIQLGQGPRTSGWLIICNLLSN